MSELLANWMERYSPKTNTEYENALKEIIQEIALFGLAQAKFFEHACFYGGTALRIMYKLPRFSEDLDFSLLQKNKDFDMSTYYQAIEKHLVAFGLSINHIKQKTKTARSSVNSAFIKADTKTNILKITANQQIGDFFPKGKEVRIKVEVDTLPPLGFQTETKQLLMPQIHSVKTMTIDNLFAGKLHAVLARKWQNRVKGRDFYDYMWYVTRAHSVNLGHLKERLVDSGHYDLNSPLGPLELKKLLTEKFETISIEDIKSDAMKFLPTQEAEQVECWTNQTFLDSLQFLKTI